VERTISGVFERVSAQDLTVEIQSQDPRMNNHRISSELTQSPVFLIDTG